MRRLLLYTLLFLPIVVAGWLRLTRGDAPDPLPVAAVAASPAPRATPRPSSSLAPVAASIREDASHARLAALLEGYDPCALYHYLQDDGDNDLRALPPRAYRLWIETALALPVDLFEGPDGFAIYDALTLASIARTPEESVAILRRSPRNADSDLALALWLGGFMHGQTGPLGGDRVEVERLFAKVAHERPEDPTPLYFWAAWDSRQGRPRDLVRARLREAYARPGLFTSPFASVRDYLKARMWLSPQAAFLATRILWHVPAVSEEPVRALLTPKEREHPDSYRRFVLHDSFGSETNDLGSRINYWLAGAPARCPELPRDFDPPSIPDGD